MRFNSQWLIAGLAISIGVGLEMGLAASPMGTAMTYQGELEEGGQPADGDYDFRFVLYDAVSVGTQIGSIVFLDNLPVSGGKFTAEIDFGADAFARDARWLEVRVRPGASVSTFTTLSPRQPLTAAPVASFALKGGFWDESGTAITNTNAGSFVGINRTSPVTGSEYFGIQAPVTGTNYGGMYIRTDSTSARPFYGYNTGTRTAWTYLAGATGKWHLFNEGERLTVAETGEVGIGTVNPTSKLHVVETGTGNAGLFDFNNSSAIGFGVSSSSNGTIGAGTYGLGSNGAAGVSGASTGTGAGVSGLATGSGFAGSFSGGENNGTSATLHIKSGNQHMRFDGNEIDGETDLFLNYNSQADVFLVTNGGAVGIGTTNVPSGVLMSVDGKVLCEEVEVQLSQDWPDYVFEDDYELTPLSELEASVREHKHLPGIPSAREVKEEGIAVGSMQADLLEKVEELTLYVIDLNKQVESVRQENQRLREQLNARITGSSS